MYVCKKSPNEKLFDILNYTIIVVFSILCLYPFVYIFNISISEGSSAAKYGLHLIPQDITFRYYAKMFGTNVVLMGFINSVIRTVMGTALMLIFTILGAYPLSKKDFPNRQFWTTFILITMFFSGGLIPNYFLVKGIGLYNSIWALILPGLINTFYLIVARNFIMTIPDSLEESAKIDGANDIRILISIILPVCKPILATIALWAAVYHWNAWFDCLIYISNPNKTVLQVVLYSIVNAGSVQVLTGNLSDETPYTAVIKCCTIMITVIPIVVVYPFLQKYFITGMLIGSVKE